MKKFFEPLPVIFSMDGGVKYYPSNTMQAFRSGFEDGAEAASISIQLSSDNELMVISSDTLDNICDLSGMVSARTSRELTSCDAGYFFSPDGESYPFRGKGYSFLTLEELFEEFPDKKFNIVLMNKDVNLVRKYVDIVRHYNAEGRVLTASVHSRNISIVRQMMPEAATAFSFSGIIGIYALFKSGLIHFSGGFRADSLQTPEAIGVSYIANGGLVKQMHKRGIWVQVWNVRDRAQLKRLIDSGVDSFMTGDVRALKEMLNK